MQARKRTEAAQSSAADVKHPTRVHTKYGVQAWKSWVRWREMQPNLEMPKFGCESLLSCYYLLTNLVIYLLTNLPAYLHTYLPTY